MELVINMKEELNDQVGRGSNTEINKSTKPLLPINQRDNRKEWLMSFGCWITSRLRPE